MSDSAGVYNAVSGAVSSVDIHSLLYGGNSTLMFAYVMPWFCMNAGSTTTGVGTLCQNHLQVGYNSNDAATVDGQAQDMIRRGFNGAVLDWYGSGLGFYDAVAQRYRDSLNARCTAPQSCPLLLALMEDQGSFEWSGGPTGSGCPQDGGGTDQTSCILAKLESDMDYMNANYFASNSYLKIDNTPGSPTYMKATPGGKPVVLFFICEECWTNPAPDWVTIWNNLRAYTNAYSSGSPAMFFIFRNAPAFSHAQSDGGYAWVNWDTTNGPDPYGLNYLASFYSTAGTAVYNNPHLLTFGGGWKGFDETNAPWVSGTPRTIDQQCGQTWLQTIQKANSYYGTSSPLPFLGVATWNDYEEGTEIETGIDNCLTLSASLSGSVLSWTPAFSSASGSESTVSSYAVYSSTDGATLTLLANVAAGSHSLDLSSFSLASGTYTMYVQAIGQPSILNKMSNAVTYTPAPPPTTGTISGVVKDVSTGAAIASATVTDGAAATSTSTTGTYSLTNVNPGTYTVHASASGYLSASQAASVSAGTTSTVNFALATAGKIAGTVKNGSGAALANASVTITGGRVATTVTVTTNSYGKYNSGWIPVGSYTISVSKSGYATQSKSATVYTGKTATVNFTMH